MKFEYTHSSVPGWKVSVELSEDANIGDVLREFEAFLRAAGYGFEGHVTIEIGELV